MKKNNSNEFEMEFETKNSLSQFDDQNEKSGFPLNPSKFKKPNNLNS